MSRPVNALILSLAISLVSQSAGVAMEQETTQTPTTTTQTSTKSKSNYYYDLEDKVLWGLIGVGGVLVTLGCFKKPFKILKWPLIIVGGSMAGYGITIKTLQYLGDREQAQQTQTTETTPAA